MRSSLKGPEHRRPPEGRRSPGIRPDTRDRFAKWGAAFLVILLLALLSPGAIAPEYRSYPPNTVTVTTGTGGGTVDYLYSVDTLVYSVLEEDVGASSTHTATEEWIVVGTLDSGTFPGDMQTQDDTGVVYEEVDDDNGALTGDAMYLNPMGAGTFTEWDFQSAAGFHWDKVDENPHDAAVSFVYTPTVNDDDTYAMEDAAFAVGTKEAGTITTVVWCTVPPNGIATGSIQHDVYTGILHRSVGIYPCFQNIWTNTTTVWATNPDTGLEWTVAEIDALEAGMMLQATTDRVDVTSVGIVMPTQDLNFVLDVRHNVTGVPAGREFYELTMRASRVSEVAGIRVWNYRLSSWNWMFNVGTGAYVTYTFDLIEADHVSGGVVRVRTYSIAPDTVPGQQVDIDLLQVRAYDVEYALEVSFNWVGLESKGSPILSVVGYKSDAELMTLQVLRSGAWTTLDANMFIAGIMTSWAFTLASADVEGSALQVRFIDNDDTDNAASTIYLDLLTVRVEMVDEAPAAPIDVYVDVSYNLWGNEIILSVRWVQTGGPEPALERGKWATVWADGVEVGTYTIGDGARRVAAPWSFFDGRDHNVTVVGAVNVEWPTWGGWQTYFSDPELERVSNFPRFAVLMFGLFCLLAVVAIVAVRAIQKRREEDEKGP